MSALPTTARDLARAVEAAMHAGDTDLLHALAPCQCCCDEHTYGEACPAWSWGGCRGGNPSSPTRASEERAWARHYADHHGMSEAEFFDLDRSSHLGTMEDRP